ncbi:GTPase HflX [Patescibacteria group bacterium]|nr:MAG: GTPase HflX [Patescibacteria group bacterium]
MRSDTRVRAILVDLIHPRMLPEHALDRLSELEELTRTYGGIVVVKAYQRRFNPHPRTFLGPGKVTDLAEEGKALGAKLLVVNDRLKPQQAYNVEQMLKGTGIAVWDRLDLILKIFARHARTTEAKLEIELASVRHMGPRIFGMGMELSRQGGGTGTRGVGETNIERMKRHLREKERRIKEKLETHHGVRKTHQQGRKRSGFKTVAVVGYTNAGKTTLLNALTGRKEYAADELFATLDTRVGKLYLPRAGREALVSDTIGFIKQLPPELLNAFASTLSEAVEADLLLHVVDGSDAHAPAHVKVVDEILIRLGAADIPRLMVINKADAMGSAAPVPLSRALDGRRKVLVSAETGGGIPELVAKIDGML